MKRALLIFVCTPLLCFGEEAPREGSCDTQAQRTPVTVYAKLASFKEDGDGIEFVEACTLKTRIVKVCAVTKTVKHEIQWPCFPKDGSPDYLEPAYRIDFLDVPADK